MNTCGTCKHFGERVRELDSWDDEGDKPIEARLHKCELVVHLLPDYENEKIPQAIAGVIDSSGYYSALCVSEEFGCNQWEQK